MEGMSRMWVIFRPASFLAEKIETKELLSLWEEGLSRGILQKGPRDLNSGNEDLRVCACGQRQLIGSRVSLKSLQRLL